MSTKRPTDSEDDDSFFDDDLFDSDLFEGDDEDVVVHRPSLRVQEYDEYGDHQDDDSLFDALIDDSVGLAPLGAGASRKDIQEDFEEDHTEVIMDEDVELPNTYFTDEQGKVFHVRRTPFLIGRSKECDLVINVKGVSRRHAELSFGAGHFVVRDLDSLNGTRVNGTPVPQIRLSDADVIQLGRHKFNFFTDTTRVEQRHKPKTNAARRNLKKPAIRPLPPRSKPEEQDYNHSRQSNSDWLVKFNFVIVAVIILVTLTYVIWEDMNGYDEEAVQQQNAPTNTPAQQQYTADQAGMLALDGDWTTTGVLPPIDDEVEQIARAVEAQMKSSQARLGRNNAEKPEAGETNRLVEEVKAIKEAEASERALQAKIQAEQAEEELERRSVLETNQANSLLATVQKAYITGDKLSTKLTQMKKLSKSNALNGRIRRELGNTHDVYKTLVDRFNAGDKLYEAGDSDAAFRQWQDLVSQEQNIIGDEQSYFGKMIKDRAIDMTAEKARIADANDNFAEALKLYQRLVKLRPEGPYKAKIDQLFAGAEQKFTAAEKVMSSDPGKAVRMLQSVMDATPRDHPLHVRAESKLVWLKEGL